jgi:hypothetical protein
MQLARRSDLRAERKTQPPSHSSTTGCARIWQLVQSGVAKFNSLLVLQIAACRPLACVDRRGSTTRHTIGQGFTTRTPGLKVQPPIGRRSLERAHPPQRSLKGRWRLSRPNAGPTSVGRSVEQVLPALSRHLRPQGSAPDSGPSTDPSSPMHIAAGADAVAWAAEAA